MADGVSIDTAAGGLQGLLAREQRERWRGERRAGLGRLGWAQPTERRENMADEKETTEQQAEREDLEVEEEQAEDVKGGPLAKIGKA